MGEELKVHVERDPEECSICLDESATCILIPCGHKACCSNSSCKQVVLSHGKCPLCRTSFEGMTDLHSGSTDEVTTPAVQRQNSRPRYPRLSWASSFLRLLRLEQPEEAQQQEEEVNLCSICLDERATCVLTPCDHRVCCSTPDCKRVVRNHGKCPLCRIEIQAITDLQSGDNETLQEQEQDQDTQAEQQEERTSKILWIRILFSGAMIVATPFVLVSFLDSRFPDAGYQERGTMLLVEGLKYYGIMLLLFVVLSCAVFIAFLTVIFVPFSIFSNGENAYAALGFRLAPLMKVCGMIIMVSWWPDYTDNYVNEKGRLKTLLRGVLVSLPDNVFTAWLISLVLVPEEFEQVDNSIRDLCLLAGTMYSPFYCPLLTIVFPDLLVNLTNTT